MAKLVQLKDNDGYVYPELSPSYKSLLGTLQYKGNINYSDNFNNLIETGMYWYNAYTGSDTGSNRPTNTKTMGILLVFAVTNEYLSQIVFFNNGCWYRNIQAANITSWVKLG